jgi:hypothetical protein
MPRLLENESAMPGYGEPFLLLHMAVGVSLTILAQSTWRVRVLESGRQIQKGTVICECANSTMSLYFCTVAYFTVHNASSLPWHSLEYCSNRSDPINLDQTAKIGPNSRRCSNSAQIQRIQIPHGCYITVLQESNKMHACAILLLWWRHMFGEQNAWWLSVQWLLSSPYEFALFITIALFISSCWHLGSVCYCFSTAFSSWKGEKPNA